MGTKIFFIFDTNFIWNLIEIAKDQKIPYESLLDDIGLYLHDNDHYLVIPDKIKKELGQISKIKDFNSYFQKKRTHDQR